MTFGNEQARVAFAIERLLAPDDAWRALVREMVARWPRLPIFEISAALIAAASAIEKNLKGAGVGEGAAARGYKLAALLSLDVYAMELLEMERGCAADLLAYWEIDPYFNRL